MLIHSVSVMNVGFFRAFSKSWFVKMLYHNICRYVAFRRSTKEKLKILFSEYKQKILPPIQYYSHVFAYAIEDELPTEMFCRKLYTGVAYNRYEFFCDFADVPNSQMPSNKRRTHISARQNEC